MRLCMFFGFCGFDLTLPLLTSLVFTANILGCYAMDGVGWGGVGVLLTAPVLANILDATPWMGRLRKYPWPKRCSNSGVSRSLSVRSCRFLVA